MNSSEVFDAIESIANTSSKNDKLALLKTHIDDPLFKRVCGW